MHGGLLDGSPDAVKVYDVTSGSFASANCQVNENPSILGVTEVPCDLMVEPHVPGRRLVLDFMCTLSLGNTYLDREVRVSR